MVLLDFDGDDPNVFNGDSRWLQLAVRSGSSNDPCDFTTLNPRQELTPTPYALYAKTAGTDNDWMVSGDDMYSIPSGNVGIGTLSPEFKLTLDNDGGILAKGTYGNGNDLAVGGEGARLIWYPKKAAFRAGYVNSDQWDDANIDNFSVGMGFNNKASGWYATISGGSTNLVSDWYATIAGGHNNTVTQEYATIGGGRSNENSAVYATISGGRDNVVSGEYASIGGGRVNTAAGDYSAVTGGQYNWSKGDYSFTAGYRAKALHDGTFVWADSNDADFESTANDQFLIRASGGVGIGTTSPDETLDVNGSMILQNGSAINEFSTDGTLGDNSDDAVPTEKSVKTYVDSQISGGSIGVVPVGGIVAWVKSFPNTPVLPDNFVECNGQTLSDPESVYDSQTIPNLNGSGGTQRFLRGAAVSGTTGGSETHTHSIATNNKAQSKGTGANDCALLNHNHGGSTGSYSTLPSYYEVVWIMRVK